MSKEEQMTGLTRARRSIEVRQGIRDGVVKDDDAVPGQPEQLRDDFQVSPSQYHHCRRAAKHRCYQAFKNRAAAAVIFGVIVVMEVQDVAQSKCSGDRQKDNLSNGAAAARDVDMCHTGRRKPRPKQCKYGAAKINNGACNMQRRRAEVPWTTRIDDPVTQCLFAGLVGSEKVTHLAAYTTAVLQSSRGDDENCARP